MTEENLTTQELAVVDAMAEGLSNEETRQKAGLTQTNHALNKVMLSPAVRRYAKRHVKGKIDIEASPQAYAYLLKTMKSEATPMQIRVDVAKYFVSHSIAPKKGDKVDDGAQKDLNEMNNLELAAFIQQGDKELAKRGMVIDVTPAKSIDDLI